jgi:hypothetical protein
MADQNTPQPALGTDLSKFNLYGTSDTDLQNLKDAQQDILKGLENRYAQPNWFKIAAGFAKPQLGGFMASLGSASEAMGENVEQQRASAIPIAQMKSQIAQSNLLLDKRQRANKLLSDWSTAHPDQPMPSALITEASKIDSDNPAVKAQIDQVKRTQEQENLSSSQQQNRINVLSGLLRSGGISQEDYNREMNSLKSQINPVGVLPTPNPETKPMNRSTIQPSNISSVESHNTPGAVGPNVQGQGTAKSSMQVMDATAINPGYGVKPAQLTGDKENDERERVRVGKDYFNALHQNFGNDKYAAIAYNWGPGKTQKWIDEGANPDKLPSDVVNYLGKASIYSAKTNQPLGQPTIESRPTQTFETSGATAPESQELVKNQLSEGDKMWAPQVEAIISNPLKVTEKKSSEYYRAGKILNDPNVQNSMGLTFGQEGFGTAFATALKSGFGAAINSPSGSFSAEVSAPVDKVLEAYKVPPETRRKLIELQRIIMDDAVSDLKEGNKALGGGHTSTTEFQTLMSRIAQTTEPYKLMQQYIAKRAVENSLNEKLHDHWLNYSSKPDFAKKSYGEFFKSPEYKNAIKEYGVQYRKAQSIND